MNQPENTSGTGWWSARFRIRWPDDAQPSWYLDVLLAHKIIAPVLNTYRQDIYLWRFHRRAARDEEGHQFSFIFYSSQETARRMYMSLVQDPMLKRLKRSGLLLSDIYDSPDVVLKPHIEDTSDPHWSSSIRKTWPYFIMGVSEMWIQLITEIIQENPPIQKKVSLSKTSDLYRRITEKINKIWQYEGGHSLLHHLSAIYGYEQLLVYERNWRSY